MDKCWKIFLRGVGQCLSGIRSFYRSMYVLVRVNTPSFRELLKILRGFVLPLSDSAHAIIQHSCVWEGKRERKKEDLSNSRRVMLLPCKKIHGDMRKSTGTSCLKLGPATMNAADCAPCRKIGTARSHLFSFPAHVTMYNLLYGIHIPHIVYVLLLLFIIQRRYLLYSPLYISGITFARSRVGAHVL